MFAIDIAVEFVWAVFDVEVEAAETKALEPVRVLVVVALPVVVQEVVPFSNPPFEGFCPHPTIAQSDSNKVRQKATGRRHTAWQGGVVIFRFMLKKLGGRICKSHERAHGEARSDAVSSVFQLDFGKLSEADLMAQRPGESRTSGHIRTFQMREFSIKSGFVA